jgi:hypothetical protein
MTNALKSKLKKISQAMEIIATWLINNEFLHKGLFISFTMHSIFGIFQEQQLKGEITKKCLTSAKQVRSSYFTRVCLYEWQPRFVSARGHASATPQRHFF